MGDGSVTMSAVLAKGERWSGMWKGRVGGGSWEARKSLGATNVYSCSELPELHVASKLTCSVTECLAQAQI